MIERFPPLSIDVHPCFLCYSQCIYFSLKTALENEEEDWHEINSLCFLKFKFNSIIKTHFQGLRKVTTLPDKETEKNNQKM